MKYGKFGYSCQRFRDFPVMARKPHNRIHMVMTPSPTDKNTFGFRPFQGSPKGFRASFKAFQRCFKGFQMSFKGFHTHSKGFRFLPAAKSRNQPAAKYKNQPAAYRQHRLTGGTSDKKFRKFFCFLLYLQPPGRATVYYRA